MQKKNKIWVMRSGWKIGITHKDGAYLIEYPKDYEVRHDEPRSFSTWDELFAWLKSSKLCASTLALCREGLNGNA